MLSCCTWIRFTSRKKLKTFFGFHNGRCFFTVGNSLLRQQKWWKITFTAPHTMASENMSIHVVYYRIENSNVQMCAIFWIVCCLTVTYHRALVSFHMHDIFFQLSGKDMNFWWPFVWWCHEVGSNACQKTKYQQFLAHLNLHSQRDILFIRCFGLTIFQLQCTCQKYFILLYRLPCADNFRQMFIVRESSVCIICVRFFSLLFCLHGT